MYLLQCNEDNSLIIADDKHVVCDKASAKIGDYVSFFYKKNKYTGKILEQSDDENALKCTIEKLKMQDKKFKPKKLNFLPSNAKRQPKPKRSYSPSSNSTDTMKKIKYDKESKISQIESKSQSPSFQQHNKENSEDLDFEHNATSDSNVTLESNEENEENGLTESPIKTENDSSKIDNKALKKNLQSTEKTLKEQDTSLTISKQILSKGLSVKEYNRDHLDETEKNIINGQSKKITDCSDDDEEELIDQLYGEKYNGERMKEIGNGIFCKMLDYKLATKQSNQATAVARNLLTGVFKKEILLRATMTGRSARAQGMARSQEKMIRLNDKAKETIIKFALELAVKKNWEQKLNNTDENKIKEAMSQRIVELKNEARKNASKKS